MRPIERSCLAAVFLALAASGARADHHEFRYVNFGVTSPVQTGDTVVVYLKNGSLPQSLRVAFYDSAGAELTSVSRDLAPEGSSGDSLVATWQNSGPDKDFVVVGISASLYLTTPDNSYGSVTWIVTGFDANQSLGFLTDQRSFLGASVHASSGTHAGSEEISIQRFQNYPNPFRVAEGTHFLYAVSETVPLDSIGIRIWSSSGRLVRSLTFDNAPYRGVLAWDGRDAAGEPVATGVYVAEILVNSGHAAASRLRIAAVGEQP